MTDKNVSLLLLDKGILQNIRKLPSVKTLESWLAEFPEMVYDGDTLTCTTCNTTLSCRRRSDIVKHRSREKHKSFGLNESNVPERQNNFNKQLVKFINGCKIPWKRLENPCFRQFIKKCISGKFGNVQVPTEKTLKNFLLKKEGSSKKLGKSNITPSKSKKNILKVKIGRK